MLFGVTSTHSSSRISSSACSSESGRGGMSRTVSSEPPARGDEVFHASPAGSVVDHLLHATLAQREQLRHDADVVLGDVDRDALDGLMTLAVDLAGQHLRLSDSELEAFATHQLDEDREL